MTTSEALKKIEEHRRNKWEEAWPGFLDVAEAALREKAEREEAAKPRVTLKEQVEALRWASTLTGMGPAVAAAAETIRRLDEVGGNLFRVHNANRSCMCNWCGLAKSLGVEPKP